MEKTKVLFVTQEITPYLKDTPLSKICRTLPQGIQEKGNEIRTFMPRFGIINERRNQLHEVIRLSGMNLVIDDTDHPLIIKVASIQSARMQIYFIDNDDYFNRKYTLTDKNKKMFADNDERTIFYNRGVLETAKKLGWGPDLVHCHGWMTSLTPLYIKTAYKDNPLFSDTKIIYSIYDDSFTGSLDKGMAEKIMLEGMSEEDKAKYISPTYLNITKAAIDYADGFILGSAKISPEILAYLADSKKPVLAYMPTEEKDYIEAYASFYDEVMVKEPILSE